MAFSASRTRPQTLKKVTELRIKENKRKEKFLWLIYFNFDVVCPFLVFFFNLCSAKT